MNNVGKKHKNVPDESRAGALEAILFVSPRPLSAKLLAGRLGLTEAEVLTLLGKYAEALRSPSRGLQLRETNGSWRLETKPEHAAMIRAARAEREERPLSAPALEALAVVALRQPVATDEVNAIRGLDSAATLDTLHKRKMIAKTHDPSVAKGSLWRTTQNFLDLFGLASLADLYRGNKLERVFGPAHGSLVPTEQAASPTGAAGGQVPKPS